jgi:hypothetical protein
MAHWGRGGIAPLFLNLGRGRGWLVSSMPRPHSPPGKVPVPIVGGWVGPRAGLDVEGRGKILRRGSNPGRLVRSLVTILSYPAHNKRKGKELSTPHKKKRTRRKIKTDIDNFDKCVIPRTIKEFHTTEGECPPLQSLLLVLKKRLTSETASGLFGK